MAAWTMSDIVGGDQEGQASPSEGANTQDGPKPAPEPEVIEVALGKLVVIAPKLVYTINGDRQDMHGVPVDTIIAVGDLSCRNDIGDKGFVRRRPRTPGLYVTLSLQPLGYRVIL